MKLSLCMIAKDEEKFLSDCLNSVKDLVDEIIFVDTGSADNTIKIAKSFGAKVYSQEWEDDFSKPRNFSLSKATGDFILVLDPDERIAKQDIQRIKNLISKKKSIAYSMPTRNYSFAKKAFLKYFNSNDEYESINESMPFYWVSTKTRIFPNNKHIEFKGKVHEIVEKSIEEQGIKIEEVNIPIHHYAQLDEKRSRHKRFFYMNITRKKVLDNPKDAKAHLELGREYFNLRLYYRAVQAFKKGLKYATNNKLLFELNNQTGNALEYMNKKNEAKIFFMKAQQIKSGEKGVPILSYHEIGDSDSDWSLSFEQFKKQILFLEKKGYEFVTLDNIDYNKKQIVITFDDGRLSVYKTAIPFLDRHGIKSTIFITTDWIEGKNISEQEAYSKFMDWRQVKELSDQGHLLGSHTITHRDLTFLNKEYIKKELIDSKKIIETKIEKQVEAFSYPYGHYNDEIIRLTKDVGYKLGVTEDKNFCSESNLKMPRIYVLRKTSLNNFKLFF